MTAAVVSRARARALLAAALSSALPERLATSAAIRASRLVQLGEHRHDLAHVVGVEGGELGLERRLLDLDLGEAVAQPLRLAVRRRGAREQLASALAGRSVHRAHDDAPGLGRVPPVATNERFMPVPPEAVWEALADPGGYGYWVVGSKEIRDAEPDWPAPGSRFHHTSASGRSRSRDHTESLEAERPRLLRLRAKGRPLGTATVTLTLTPRGRRHARADDREPRRAARLAGAQPARARAPAAATPSR